MGLFLNLALLVLGTTGALAAFGGDTWLREKLPWSKRITGRGWLALACMIATLCLGIVKEVHNGNQAAASAAKQEQLAKELAASTKSLHETRTKLAAVEPSILEGIILATSGIRRESDFSTPTLDGQTSLRLVSGRNSPEPLELYGGDYLEYHVFCSNNGRRTSGFPFPSPRQSASSLRIRVGTTDYPLGEEGRHMIIGPIGMPMPVTLFNPFGLRDCTVKILIESADRTRVQKQLSPLLEVIRNARESESK
jgi:hypothetical protein